MLQSMAPNFHGKILPITGTPIPNDGAEIYVNFWTVASPTIYEAISKILDYGNFEKFRAMFTNQSTASVKQRDPFSPTGFSYRQVTKYEGVADEERFFKLIAPYTHYRRAEDCIDLPEMQDIPINLSIPDDDLLKNANVEKPDFYMAKLERIATAKTPYAVAWL